MSTRVTHQVRVRKKDDPSTWVDVEVLDALMLQYPAGGDAVGFILTNKVQGVTIEVAIIDNTGDGNGKGDPAHCSRLSHMERVQSPDDPSQTLDIEVLDGFALSPPNTNTANESNEDGDQDFQTPLGLPDSGDYNSAQHAFITAPLPQTPPPVAMVVDNVGLNLAVPQTNATTRGTHVNMATNAGDTDDDTQFSDNITDSIPPTKHQWVATIKIDAINFTLPQGGDVCILVPPDTIDKVDATQYVTDPQTGKLVPPDNTDPNVYVAFPPSSGGPNLHIPDNKTTGVSGPINQGILWWIKRVSGLPDPWFWFFTPQEYKGLSFFGSPPPATPVKWGYRGFVLLNSYPVIWILSVNNPIRPMGGLGADSLEICAESGDFYTGADLPAYAMGIPGTSPIGGPMTTFAPFGYMSVLDPPLTDEEVQSQLATIWQLTGITQPNLANPMLPWNRQSNPYLWPNADVWENAAQTFASKWNAVANAMNALLNDFSGIPSDSHGVFFGNPPPGWDFDVPWYAPHGPPDADFNSFQAGIPDLLIGSSGYCGLPPEVFDPINFFTMEVAQLDQKTWDTRPVLVNDVGRAVGPFNDFGPPVTWASEATPPPP